MGVFGPKYPPPVQGVVSHAERFCELLSHAERFGLCDSVAARVFVYGRQSENRAGPRTRARRYGRGASARGGGGGIHRCVLGGAA